MISHETDHFTAQSKVLQQPEASGGELSKHLYVQLWELNSVNKNPNISKSSE